MHQRKGKQMKKAFSYILTVVLIVATAGVILYNIKPSEIPYLFYKSNKLFIFMAFAGMVLYWIMDASIIKMISKMVGVEFSLKRSLKFTLIGEYYTEITPYSIGCQPAQVYTMMNYSVPLGKATSIVIDKFVIYQIVVTFYSGIALFLRHDFVYSVTDAFFGLFIFLMVVHLLGTLVLIVLFLNHRIVDAAAIFIIPILHRLRLIRDVDAVKKKVMAHLKEYADSIDKIRGNWGTLFIVTIMTILQLSFYFSIPYFIFRGFGVESIRLVDVILLLSLLYMIVAATPTPGTIGASEGGFYILFKGMVSPSIMPYATLVWSLISYYFNLIGGGLVTLANHYMNHRTYHKTSA